MVSIHEVEASLEDSLTAVLHGDDTASAGQLARIQAGMWRTYQALPKNNKGQLAPRAVRYLVQSYFAAEHGWLINGLDPHGMQLFMTEVHNVSILRDKAPALVEALLEKKRAGSGLSMNDVVAMVAALERLICDESIQLLQEAYALNGVSMDTAINKGTLEEVLTSYLLVFELGGNGNKSDMTSHRLIKNQMAARGGSGWGALVEFERDTVSNFQFARKDIINPFVPQRYSFEEVSRIVEDMALNYGRWQNRECQMMKEELFALDPKGTGRVSIDAFYSQPATAEFQFAETVEYLTQIGALDTVRGSRPRVRIANYMAGPSNCITSSRYYSICCLSDCERLMNEIEGEIRAPKTHPEHLLMLVGNLSSPSVDAPRQITDELQRALHSIADYHKGEVLLHGRLFAQWLHFAFPNECPYPHIADDVAVFTPKYWFHTRPKEDVVAQAAERRRHVEDARRLSPDLEERSITSLQWTDDEVLILQEPIHTRRISKRPALVVREVVQLALLISGVVAALRGPWSAAEVLRGLALARKGSSRSHSLPLST